MSLLSQSLSENRRTLALAAPITAGFLGQMLMGWVDTIMVGRIGVIPLAACAFSNTVLAVPFVFGFGVLSAVSVRVSIAHGAGRERDAGEILRAGLVLGGALGLLIALLIQFGLPLLPFLGQKPEINIACVDFLLLCTWSIIPIFLTTVAKNFCEALSRPWVPFWIVLGGVLLNAFLNWILIYGNLGLPAMGLEGAGLATLLARIAVTLGIFFYLLKDTAFLRSLPKKWLAPGWLAELPALLRIGLPTGGLHLSEVTTFAACSLMMGWISVDAMAAHQIAMTCVATTFMIPLGFSQALSVRVGQLRGSGEFARLAPVVFGALGLTFALMTITALLFISGGPRIAAWFISNATVAALAANLLFMGGIFQICDGAQIVSMGALRGFEDTRTPMILGAFTYWGVALPASYLLAFWAGFGPTGIWTGLVVGLTIAAFCLVTRLALRLKKETARGFESSARP